MPDESLWLGEQPGRRSHEAGSGPAFRLSTPSIISSGLTASTRSTKSIYTDCVPQDCEKRYTTFYEDSQLGLVNEDEEDRNGVILADPGSLRLSQIFPSDEERRFAYPPDHVQPYHATGPYLASPNVSSFVTANASTTALTSTGNLLLEKAATDDQPLPLSDPDAPEPDILPAKLGVRAYRFVRWNFFSAYRRLFTIIFAANIAVLVALLVRGGTGSGGLTFTSTLDAASANLLLSILMRNEHVVNILFWLSSALPLSAPLLLRRWAAKIYAYGGVHSGCASAAVVWYIAFTGLATRHVLIEPHVHPSIVMLAYIILSLLILVAIFALPRLRATLHDYFEATHRFAGWTIIALFWAQIILFAHFNRAGNQSLGVALVTNPSFWCVIIITACIIYPWTRLRLRACTVEPLSNHAVRLHFDHTSIDYCMGVRLTDAPLKETHAFAGIPNRVDKIFGDTAPKGFSVVISDAGDWTQRIVTNPPHRIYVKGAPVYGVLRVAAVFSPVVVVATGSGIGPCLSLFHGRPDLNVRILWSTRGPLKTYGQGIIDGVLLADPKAVIIDTHAGGKSYRPDMVRLTYKLWKESGAEAVVVISNPKLTRKVVYGMETRGVPAYGPIWDS